MQTRIKTKAFFDSLDTEEHRLWKRDRDLRRQFPPTESWRGCVGLAAMLQDPDAVVEIKATGQRLVPNSNVTWLALRDVPPGHFPGSAPMHRRDVNVATAARAELRYGMPRINFAAAARNSWDFRFIPYGRVRCPLGPKPWEVVELEAAGDTLHSEHFAREFSVLNRVSAAMTRFAFRATDRAGYPVRPDWAARRRRGETARRVRPPREWFPEPYLGFRVREAADVFRLAVSAEPHGCMVPCRRCGRHVDLEAFARRADLLRVRGDLGAERWVADCPACRTTRTWFAADTVAARVQRHVPIAFKERFCQAVAEGVPLHSVGRTVYCGRLPFSPDRDFPNLPDGQVRQLDLVPHRLLNRTTGEKHLVYLPVTARVAVRPGQELEPGQVWGRAMSRPPEPAWIAKDRPGRWTSLIDAVDSVPAIALLQDLWLRHQAVVHDEIGSHQFLLPAELAAFVGRDVRPTTLFWDFANLGEFWDAGLAAAVFPPLRLHHWNDLRFSLPGDLELNASIGDPRFYANCRSHVEHRVDRLNSSIRPFRLRERLSSASSDATRGPEVLLAG